MTVVQKPPAAEARATYEGDYYGWLTQQATLLDDSGGEQADWKNIAEALRDLGSEQ